MKLTPQETGNYLIRLLDAIAKKSGTLIGNDGTQLIACCSSDELYPPLLLLKKETPEGVIKIHCSPAVDEIIEALAYTEYERAYFFDRSKLGTLKFLGLTGTTTITLRVVDKSSEIKIPFNGLTFDIKHDVDLYIDRLNQINGIGWQPTQPEMTFAKVNGVDYYGNN